MTDPMTNPDELERLAKAALDATALYENPPVGQVMAAVEWRAYACDAFEAAANPSTILALLSANREVREQVEVLEQESADLTKALTGLTCGGSEFFIRKGDRYVADITACVAWVRRGRENAHRMLVEAKRQARSSLTTQRGDGE